MVIKVMPPERDADRWGQGHFGAPRGSRTHNGIDYQCAPGSVVLSSVNGTVSKLGWVYSQRDRNHFRYVEITTNDNHRHRYFYVKPIVPEHAPIEVGDAIGVVQTLQDIFPGIQDHVHYEIMVEGDFVNPANYDFLFGGDA